MLDNIPISDACEDASRVRIKELERLVSEAQAAAIRSVILRYANSRGVRVSSPQPP